MIFDTIYNRLDILTIYRSTLFVLVIALGAILLIHTFKTKYTAWLFKPYIGRKFALKKEGILFLAFSLFASFLILLNINAYHHEITNAYQDGSVEEVSGLVSNISMYEGKGSFHIGNTRLNYYKRAGTTIHGFRDRCTPECVVVEDNYLRVKHIDGEIIQLSLGRPERT
ncbi:hypothetical protein [Hellea balneolensis]|uniref:hypothetical protein n=1 Tax=Hellea balneolensis TaxID=287478 RepID=UPI0003F5AA5F|nr:hypothetical protein [Hellea balneolensis]